MWATSTLITTLMIMIRVYVFSITLSLNRNYAGFFVCFKGNHVRNSCKKNSKREQWWNKGVVIPFAESCHRLMPPQKKKKKKTRLIIHQRQYHHYFFHFSELSWIEGLSGSIHVGAILLRINWRALWNIWENLEIQQLLAGQVY